MIYTTFSIIPNGPIATTMQKTQITFLRSANYGLKKIQLRRRQKNSKINET